MAFYRRHLPHLFVPDRPLFLNWRLHGSLPPNRSFPDATVDSGEAFALMDRLLGLARCGPVYLRQPAIADMVVEAIHYNSERLGHYALHAFAVMPNHVHLLISPAVPLPRLTKSLKGITAKQANAMLGLMGTPFWQEESYDHLVRDAAEFRKILNYIEENPVRAGLAADRWGYRWSSAWAATAETALGATGGSPADQGVRPTLRD